MELGKWKMKRNSELETELGTELGAELGIRIGCPNKLSQPFQFHNKSILFKHVADVEFRVADAKSN